MSNLLKKTTMEKNVAQLIEQLENQVKNGQKLPDLSALLSVEQIDYDMVDALLVIQPEQIKKIDSYYSPKTSILAYSVPASLDKELQKGEIRAICIIAYCLPQNKFEQVCSKFGSKGKRRMLRRSYERFQEAKRIATA